MASPAAEARLPRPPPNGTVLEDDMVEADLARASAPTDGTVVQFGGSEGLLADTDAHVASLPEEESQRPANGEDVRSEEHRQPSKASKATTGGKAIDIVPPAASLMTNLESVLKGQFGELGEEDLAVNAKRQTESDNLRSSTGAPMQILGAGEDGARVSIVKNELEHVNTTCMTSIIENKSFTIFFMVLTFYALFVPDLDLLLGNNTSKLVFSIITSVVVILFLVELGCQSYGRKKYFLRAYFWLDVVALISLMPDTWFVQNLFSANNAFVAGRSSRLTRLIRIASRSSKATRLNRLTRIVRVASLMPRLGAFFGHRVKDDDTEKVLEKKLRRVFMFLDEDMDGLIPRSAVFSCLKKIKQEGQNDQNQEGLLKGTVAKMSPHAQKIANAFSKKVMGGTRLLEGAHSLTRAGRSSAELASEAASSQGEEDAGILSEPPSPTKTPTPRSPKVRGAAESKNGAVVDLPGSLNNGSGSPVRLAPADNQPGISSKASAGFSQAGPVSPSSPTASPSSPQLFKSETANLSPTKIGLTSRLKNTMSKITKVRPMEEYASIDDDLPPIDDDDLVTFKDFRLIMMSDEVIGVRLRRACQQQLRQGNNMKNLTSRHSEYIAVKVALGVLVLLFVLGWVEPDVQDLSAERGLSHITELTRMKYSSHTTNSYIPRLIHDQVAVWTKGAGVDPEKREVLYLDLEKKVYCNELKHGGRTCEPSATATIQWEYYRNSINEIDDAVKDSDYRQIDLLPVRVPDISPDDMSDAELQDRTQSVALMYIRGQVQSEAVMSIMTTILVIIIILSGIVLLTKDLTFLSRNLLKPLRELADDMESIAQLQLAGVSSTEDSVIEEGTSEVRLIRRTFENMKKAIKSWGKYVPWPVVQLLLRANVEANLEVNEVEVTIFFSDIASFTTIVESMPPESSLLLLSRYFNDMSKVIDDHGGVVLEFIGDAILCIYGAPLINPDHPTAAVKSSLRMLQSLRRMNEWSAARKLPEVKIRCGVHTGRVLVGNMGFHSRMKYGIVGEDAHIPSRLEEINKTYSTNMMVSQATWSKLDTNLFITRPIDYVNLRQTPGAASEPIYQVLDRERKSVKAHPLWEPMTLHTQAMELYRKGDFKGAIGKFTKVNKIVMDITGGEDAPSTLMIKRSESYLEQPPPADWDGVWDRGSGD